MISSVKLWAFFSLLTFWEGQKGLKHKGGWVLYSFRCSLGRLRMTGPPTTLTLQTQGVGWGRGVWPQWDIQPNCGILPLPPCHIINSSHIWQLRGPPWRGWAQPHVHCEEGNFEPVYSSMKVKAELPVRCESLIKEIQEKVISRKENKSLLKFQQQNVYTFTLSLQSTQCERRLGTEILQEQPCRKPCSFSSSDLSLLSGH